MSAYPGNLPITIFYPKGVAARFSLTPHHAPHEKLKHLLLDHSNSASTS